MTERISVIVPIYNVEPYLKTCLDSLLFQTHPQLQIILVDDGSTDRCGEICLEYAAKDPRITLISQENRGVSAARNAGLDAATGQWIGWVDPDDWIEENMFQHLLENALREEADISICGRFQEYPHRTVPFGPVEHTLLGREEALLALLEEKELDNALYDKLYRRELFDGICFPEGRTYEDLAVLYRVFEKAGRICLSPKPLYHYRQRPTGIVGNTGLRNRMNHYLAARQRLEDMAPRYAAFEGLLRGRCVTAALGLWAAYYRNPPSVRRAYRSQLEEVSHFCAPMCRDASGMPGVGLAGRFVTKLIPYPTCWAFALAGLIGWLYERKNGRTL